MSEEIHQVPISHLSQLKTRAHGPQALCTLEILCSPSLNSFTKAHFSMKMFHAQIREQAGKINHKIFFSVIQVMRNHLKT